MSPRIIAVVCMLVASLSVVSCTGTCTCDTTKIVPGFLPAECCNVVVVVSVTGEPQDDHYDATVVRVEMGSSNVVTEEDDINFQIVSSCPSLSITADTEKYYIISATKNDFQDMLTEAGLPFSEWPVLPCSHLVELPCISECEGSFDAPDLEVCDNMED